MTHYLIPFDTEQRVYLTQELIEQSKISYHWVVTQGFGIHGIM